MNFSLNIGMMIFLLFLGSIYYYKAKPLAHMYEKMTEVDSTESFEDKFVSVSFFNATKKGNCNNSGVFAIKHNSTEFYPFLTNNFYFHEIRKVSLESCYNVAKKTNSSILLHDFFDNFANFDFKKSKSCQFYQNLISNIRGNDKEYITLEVGIINKIAILAVMPLNLCHNYILEKFMHENIDLILPMFTIKSNKNSPINTNASETKNSKTTVNFSETKNRISKYNDTLIGPISLMYLLTQRIQCADSKIIPENIHYDLENIKSMNIGCFAFDLKYENRNEFQNIAFIFASKLGVEFNTNASVGQLYELISTYVNGEIIYGERYAKRLIAENILLDSEADCQNPLFFSISSNVNAIVQDNQTLQLLTE